MLELQPLERKPMCNLCYAEKNGINIISVNPNTLCYPHYQEWAEEKNAFEVFGTSDFLGLVNL